MSRRRIMDVVKSLAADPFQHGDYEDSDPSGHPTSITLSGRYAVTFFVDHAMREVEIVNIQPADRG
jgi:hypothetical protein